MATRFALSAWYDGDSDAFLQCLDAKCETSHGAWLLRDNPILLDELHTAVISKIVEAAFDDEDEQSTAATVSLLNKAGAHVGTDTLKTTLSHLCCILSFGKQTSDGIDVAVKALGTPENLPEVLAHIFEKPSAKNKFRAAKQFVTQLAVDGGLKKDLEDIHSQLLKIEEEAQEVAAAKDSAEFDKALVTSIFGAKQLSRLHMRLRGIRSKGSEQFKAKHKDRDCKSHSKESIKESLGKCFFFVLRFVAIFFCPCRSV